MPRPKGSKNAKTLLIQELGYRAGYDPAVRLIKRAMDPKQPEEVRHDCDKTLMRYFHPMRNSIDMSIEGSVTVELGIEPEAIDVIGKIINSRKS